MNRDHRQDHPKSVVSTYGHLACSLLATFSLLLFVLLVTACGPGFVPLSEPTHENQLQATGYQAPDGKNHTGAGGDDELERIKELVSQNGIESLSQVDRDLAASIASAKTENLADEKIRVHIVFRDSSPQNSGITFEFTDKNIAPKQKKDAGNEVRYKSITGKNKDGTDAAFEAALMCRKQIAEIPKITVPGCQSVTVALKEAAANGGRAALVLRHQLVTVHTKTRVTLFKHETLKRLNSELQIPKAGELKTFEVAWGPSGFALTFGDTQICPVGRLVETNDSDEPLRLNCSGTPTIKDLEGRMIGNSTRGELLLQIATTLNSVPTPGVSLGDTSERLFLVIRQKHPTKKSAPQTSTPSGAGGSATSPSKDSTSAPPNAPGTPANDDDDDDDDDLVFDADRKTPSAPPPVKLPTTAGWLIPINANHSFTKVLANDRRHPAIDRGIKTWLNGSRLTSFAQNFLPNRALVTSKLAINQVPAEFALILFGESRFFINKGYPLDQQFKSSAWGPWQFLDLTASNNGLKIYPRNVNKRFVPGNPCDERADLGKSTEAAGRYLRSIINMFPNDPKLVLLGYNQGEFGVNRKVNSLKNTESQERLAAIKEMGLNYWTIRRFNMASAGGIKYVENFVSVYHAALESDPVAADPSVEPWKPSPQCSAH